MDTHGALCDLLCRDALVTAGQRKRKRRFLDTNSGIYQSDPFPYHPEVFAGHRYGYLSHSSHCQHLRQYPDVRSSGLFPAPALERNAKLAAYLGDGAADHAGGGTGAVVFEETSEKLSVPTSLIQNYSKTNRYSVINSRGDSMTPFIQDRDKLIVEHWNGGQIIDNCIYVFRYANELFVKRLVKNITQIVIKSDNPLYEPIKITDKDQDFEVIGQIVGLMRDLR